MCSIYFIIVILSFFFGSIPSGYIFAKIKKIDVTKIGSGNIGTINVARAIGWKWGILTFFCDMLKGFIPLILLYLLNLYDFIKLNDILIIFTSLSVIIGHIYTPWLNFKGGKGVATSFGVIVAISSEIAVVSLLCFAAIVWYRKISSIGSIGSTLFAFILSLLEWIFNWNLLRFIPISNQSVVILMISLTIIIIFTHRSNIKRLIKGEELKIKG